MLLHRAYVCGLFIVSLTIESGPICFFNLFIGFGVRDWRPHDEDAFGSLFNFVYRERRTVVVRSTCAIAARQ